MFPSPARESDEAPSWSPSPARRLLRRRDVYWALAAALALAAGVIAHGQTSDARAIVARLGATTQVLVADVELAPGDPLAPAATLVAVPVGLAPEGAVSSPLADGVAARRIAAGAIVTAFDLDDATAPGPDEASVAVASSVSTPPVRPGDDVTLVLAADPFVGLEGRLVDGRVVTNVDDRVVVAVARSDLADVAAALQAGGLTVAAG